MKDLTLSFTIIIKGCMTKNMTPEQIAEQLNEHVQHEVKNLNIPAVMESDCDHEWINNSFDQFGFLQEQICDKCGAKQSVP